MTTAEVEEWTEKAEVVEFRLGGTYLPWGTLGQPLVSSATKIALQQTEKGDTVLFFFFFSYTLQAVLAG